MRINLHIIIVIKLRRSKNSRHFKYVRYFEMIISFMRSSPLCSLLNGAFFETFSMISKTNSHLHFDYSFEITQKICQQNVRAKIYV